MLVPAAAAVAESEVAGHTDYILRTPGAAHNTDHIHHRTVAAAVGIAETADLVEMSARLAGKLALADSCQCVGVVVFVGRGSRRVRLARPPTN